LVPDGIVVAIVSDELERIWQRPAQSGAKLSAMNARTKETLRGRIADDPFGRHKGYM
jgi:hypothetical protein